jgi:hypothetical protein
MMRGQRALRDSQPPSPDGSEDDEARSPVSNNGDATTGLKTSPFLRRGREGKSESELDLEQGEDEDEGEGEDEDEEEHEKDPMDVMH